MLLFLMVLMKWQEQFEGRSSRNEVLAVHKWSSRLLQEGQLEDGGGKAEARSDCLSPENGTNFQCSYASWALGRHQGIQLNGI